MKTKEKEAKKNIRCLLAAGTTEGLEAMQLLDEIGIETAACVATALGRKMLEHTKAHIYSGRMDAAAFARFIEEKAIDFVVDATHPFAVEVTQNLKMAAEAKKIPYIRYVRKSAAYAYEKLIHAADAGAAAEGLLTIKGNILLTTGANTAAVYKAVLPDFNERVYIRVLDTAASKTLCRTVGIDEAHVIAQNPPFSLEDNCSLIEKYDIAVLVSKDSGVRGGLLEKIESAKAFGIPVILIDRPDGDEGVEDLAALRGWIFNTVRRCLCQTEE